MNITLGRTYKDIISGFKGVATAHTLYITGCNQVLLGPKIKGDGILQASEWFDEQRLTLCRDKIITLDNDVTPGFGPEAPKR